MAESVDALDLKSNWGSTSVPVQVWPRAILQKTFPYWKGFLFIEVKIIRLRRTIVLAYQTMNSKYPFAPELDFEQKKPAQQVLLQE